MQIKKRSISIIGLACAIYAVLNPFDFTGAQVVLSTALIAGISLWTTGAIDKTITSIGLLFIFVLVGKNSPAEIMGFIWSDTALLIMTTSLLSAGITRTGLVEKLVSKILEKTGYKLNVLLLLPYILGVVLIFLIPQAFARSVILARFFYNILSDDEKYAKLKQVLLFNVFWAISITYMFFSNGDIVLNQSAISFGGQMAMAELGFGNWASLMFVPTLILCIITFILTKIIFRKDLAGFDEGVIVFPKEEEEIGESKTGASAILMLAVIGLWMTTGVHGISEWLVAFVAVIIMYGMKILKKEDLKEVNPRFIIFLTAAFSIGKVMGANGISEAIFGYLQAIIPPGDSPFFLLALALVTMVLHVIIGSAVATLSIVLPLFIPLGLESGYSVAVIVLLSYIVVNIHFILPHHHANMMVGVGKGYYNDKLMLKYGIIMTPLTFLVLALLYIPWWNFIG